MSPEYTRQELSGFMCIYLYACGVIVFVNREFIEYVRYAHTRTLYCMQSVRSENNRQLGH